MSANSLLKVSPPSFKKYAISLTAEMLLVSHTQIPGVGLGMAHPSARDIMPYEQLN